jgi:hypothetical protein
LTPESAEEIASDMATFIAAIGREEREEEPRHSTLKKTAAELRSAAQPKAAVPTEPISLRELSLTPHRTLE